MCSHWPCPYCQVRKDERIRMRDQAGALKCNVVHLQVSMSVKGITKKIPGLTRWKTYEWRAQGSDTNYNQCHCRWKKNDQVPKEIVPRRRKIKCTWANPYVPFQKNTPNWTKKFLARTNALELELISSGYASPDPVGLREIMVLKEEAGVEEQKDLTDEGKKEQAKLTDQLAVAVLTRKPKLIQEGKSTVCWRMLV